VRNVLAHAFAPSLSLYCVMIAFPTDESMRDRLSMAKSFFRSAKLNAFIGRVAIAGVCAVVADSAISET
jgi:hypothetical protein